MSTSSFVTEVLATAGRLEKEDLHAKIVALSKRTSELEAEIYDALQKKYEDFYPNFMTAVQLNVRVNKLSEEMTAVSSRVDKEVKAQLNLSAAEFQNLSTQMEESTAILQILERLVKLNDLLEGFDTFSKEKNYIGAAKNLVEVNRILKDTKGPRDGEIKILQAIHERSQTQTERLTYDVAKAWSDNVKWKVEDNLDKNKYSLNVTLSVSSHEDPKDLLKTLIEAMQNLDLLERKLKLFSDNFLKYIVWPILTCKNLKVKLESSPEMKTLSLTAKRNSTQEEKISPKVAVSDLMVAFTFLYDNLFKLPIEIVPRTGDDVENLMRKLGCLCDQSCIQDHIIALCIRHSIPTNSKEIPEYTETISLIEGFQAHLVKLGFLSNDDSTLADFVNDINVLFANKKCQGILEKARSLMTSEIHNMVKISQEWKLDDLTPIGLEGTSSKKVKTAENAAISSESSLSSNTFRFPTCYISVSVQQIMELAHITLQEATQTENTSQCSVQLFYSVRNIFMLFCDVVPTYHRDSLEQLPQITALHHNNCMYLAHNLLTLGHQYRPKLPPPLSEGAASFIDLVPKLRRLGTEAWLSQMRRQKDQLMETLTAAQGFASVSEGDTYTEVEKALKQVLYQLQRLSNVWVEVLPRPLYNKSLGTLLNSALVETISKVTALDDISEEDARQLHSLMSIVTERAPDFFPSDSENSSTRQLLHTYARQWNKFSELIWQMNAGLQDIADKWADGKGPLAVEFHASEVKQLIRALFQNTDKRSRVLASIK